MVFIKYSIGFSALLLCKFQFLNYQSFIAFNQEKLHYIKVQNFQETTLEKSILNGKEIYVDFCMQCHNADGKGDGKNFPPLDGSDWLINKTNESIHSVKFGLTGEIVVNGKKFNNSMPAMGLSNQEVADVMNYIRNSWNNKNSKIVTLKQVEAI